MNNQRTTTIITAFRWLAFFVILLILVIRVMPRALGQPGQRVISKSTSPIKAPSHVDGGSWTVTASLNTALYLHTVALLSNGMVLVAGGYDSDTNVLASAELYDPVSGSWTPTGSLNTARTVKNATLLTNGMVLVAAGSTNSGILASAELYDPVSGSWTLTGSLNNGRSANTATLLHDR